jgi:hypothetical protein
VPAEPCSGQTVRLHRTGLENAAGFAQTIRFLNSANKLSGGVELVLFHPGGTISRLQLLHR